MLVTPPRLQPCEFGGKCRGGAVGGQALCLDDGFPVLAFSKGAHNPFPVASPPAGTASTALESRHDPPPQTAREHPDASEVAARLFALVE